MEKIIELLKKRISNVNYICKNVEFDYKEGEYLYFEAVDLANCELSVRVKIDEELPCDDWEMYESYGDEWNVVK